MGEGLLVEGGLRIMILDSRRGRSRRVWCMDIKVESFNNRFDRLELRDGFYSLASRRST
jgi:hypothetical protein